MDLTAVRVDPGVNINNTLRTTTTQQLLAIMCTCDLQRRPLSSNNLTRVTAHHCTPNTRDNRPLNMLDRHGSWTWTVLSALLFVFSFFFLYSCFWLRVHRLIGRTLVCVLCVYAKGSHSEHLTRL